jgi:glycerol-3-phosphate acyltransferase PlsY
VGGKKPGAITFLLDLLKGFLPVYIYIYDQGMDNIALIAGVLCVIGHIFPLFNRFKGGKGVATSFGVMLAINPLVCIIMLCLWAISFILTRISSAAALLSFALMPFIFFTINSSENIMMFGIVLSMIIYICHFENIKRLLNGTEKSFK